MAAAEPAPEFPVTSCATCGRDVLCYLDLDTDDNEIARCLECATEAPPVAIRWLSLAELEALGYGYVLPEGGCGRPDCGNGRCGRATPDES